MKACVFDAYGTLFDVDAAARRLGAERPDFKPHWPKLAATWRAKQVGYSWHRTICGDYKPFREVTQDALDYALEEAGLQDNALRERLMALYMELDAYPEVPAMLKALKAAGARTAILSNGSPDMLASAVESAGVGALLDDVISVDELRCFKPDARVYALAEQRMGARGRNILFFSSNGWDAAAASAYGFEVAWVNRAGAPMERLGAPPDHVIDDLSEAAGLAE